MRLLYAIDIRDRALWHLDEVTKWARRLDAVVDIVYVNPFGDYGAYVLDPALSKALEDGLEKARAADRKVMLQALEALPEDVRGEAHLVSGDAPHAIAELGSNYGAILLCTRAIHGIQRLWLGSVAERVLRLNKGSTIVIRGRP